MVCGDIRTRVSSWWFLAPILGRTTSSLSCTGRPAAPGRPTPSATPPGCCSRHTRSPSLRPSLPAAATNSFTLFSVLAHLPSDKTCAFYQSALGRGRRHHLLDHDLVAPPRDRGLGLRPHAGAHPMRFRRGRLPILPARERNSSITQSRHARQD